MRRGCYPLVYKALITVITMFSCKAVPVAVFFLSMLLCAAAPAASGASATPCQADNDCLGCQRCGSNDECVNDENVCAEPWCRSCQATDDFPEGVCTSTCSACQECDGGGVCEDTCSDEYCLACVDGSCESTNDDVCLTCIGNDVGGGGGHLFGPRCRTEDCLDCDSDTGGCVDRCTVDQVCSQCDGEGNCLPSCDTENCFDCDGEGCVAQCTGCTSCDGAGSCAPDESLKNECGKCPGEVDFDDCCFIEKNLAFGGCLAACGSTDVCKWMDKSACRLSALEQAALSFVCAADTAGGAEACADCDTCTTDSCSEQNSCTHEVIDYDEALKCGSCVALGGCDDGNSCTYDSCVEDRCVHLLKSGCVVAPAG
jgi:hypothetical protein